MESKTHVAGIEPTGAVRVIDAETAGPDAVNVSYKLPKVPCRSVRRRISLRPGNLTDASPDLWKSLRVWAELLKEELRRAREALRDTERKLSDLEAIRGDGTEKAVALLAEGRDIGLTESSAPTNWDEALVRLKKRCSGQGRPRCSNTCT